MKTNEPFNWPENILPPVADKIPKELIAHGDKRIDKYYWLNDFFKQGPHSAKALEYLEAENGYLDTMMGGTKQFRQSLFDELKARIKEKDESVPYRENSYWYYIRFEEGYQYPIYCRKIETLSSPEEVIHDSNTAANSKSYYKASGLKVSDDNRLLAIGEDDVSRRLFKLRIKDLASGNYFPETIENTEGDDYAWAADNKTVFYILKDTTTLLGNQVWRHVAGTDPAADVKVYEEKDNRHYLSLKRTKSKKYIVICSELTEQQSEYHILDASDPTGNFILFQSRVMGLVYDIDHYHDRFYIRTNLDAPNFRLMETLLDHTAVENWKEVIPYHQDTYLTDFTLFRDHLVLSERKEGLVNLHVIDQRNHAAHYIRFEEAAYMLHVGHNPEFTTNILRFNYTSMTTPQSVYDYNLDTRESELKKIQDIPGGYDKECYATERLFAPARDGIKIPISIVYKKGIVKDGLRPLLLYGYGSYGACSEADFDRDRLSLIDRGFIFAIAHIRGGQEMGREWYEQGKMLQKKNSFFDFIDCAEYLIAEKYTSKEHLYAYGGSAGGLLMGAVINFRPDLWNGVVADVPFVDVITTMSDPEIPLTTSEYLEWGDPDIRDQYFYMKSYSPVDNIEKKEYPAMLVTTGLHDSQVQYFESAKWVAKLRELKTDKKILLLHTNMNAGHGGASGRFDYLKEVALQYCFLLLLEGIKE